MASKIIFGTDGWRGFIAEDYTFENAAGAPRVLPNICIN